MGVNYLGARMMWDARQRGVRFDRVLTLGHLSLRLFPSEVEFFRKTYRDAFGSKTTPLDEYRWGEYVDTFLREYLGATDITVLDASEYQGADTIHDMNVPVPESWHGQYDVVIDSGSLEHIFNVPVSFSNLANMLKVGGTMFVNSPANNFMGHGFYQFSPEFMFRVFSDQNGFEVQDVLLHEARHWAGWWPSPLPGVEVTNKRTVYKVADPDDLRRRVGLVNRKPVTIMVEAKKTRAETMFATPPIQSDYAAVWSEAKSERPMLSRRRKLVKYIRELPIAIRGPVEGFRQNRMFSLRNKKFYAPQRWLS